jgi:hypothetical protein
MMEITLQTNVLATLDVYKAGGSCSLGYYFINKIFVWLYVHLFIQLGPLVPYIYAGVADDHEPLCKHIHIYKAEGSCYLGYCCVYKIP